MKYVTETCIKWDKRIRKLHRIFIYFVRYNILFGKRNTFESKKLSYLKIAIVIFSAVSDPTYFILGAYCENIYLKRKLLNLEAKILNT